jgi:hypothetical protein
MKKSWHQQFKRAPRELRISPDGVLHASVAEKERWCKLQKDVELGMIRALRRQVKYPLQIDEKRAVLTPTGQIARYTADFVYDRLQVDGQWLEVIEDRKGWMDRIAELRIAMFEAIYQKKVTIVK